MRSQSVADDQLPSMPCYRTAETQSGSLSGISVFMNMLLNVDCHCCVLRDCSVLARHNKFEVTGKKDAQWMCKFKSAVAWPPRTEWGCNKFSTVPPVAHICASLPIPFCYVHLCSCLLQVEDLTPTIYRVKQQLGMAA